MAEIRPKVLIESMKLSWLKFLVMGIVLVALFGWIVYAGFIGS